MDNFIFGNLMIKKLEKSDINDVIKFIKIIIFHPNKINEFNYKFDPNFVNEIIDRYRDVIGVTRNQVWFYLKGNTLQYCSMATMKQVLENINNSNDQRSFDQIEKHLIRVNNRLDSIESKQTNSGMFLNRLKSPDESLNRISNKIDNLDLMISHQINQKNNNDMTKGLSDIINKVGSLEKQLEYIEDDIKAQKDLLRTIRDQGDVDNNSSQQITKSINNILGTVALLKNDIENIKIDPKKEDEETKEDIDIINPDVELLKEMYETSAKLNDLIFKTALMVAKKAPENETNDSEVNNNEINENNEVEPMEMTNENNFNNKENKEVVNNEIDEENNLNDQVIIEEIKD